MNHYAGIDVSLERSSECEVNTTGELALSCALIVAMNS